MADPKLLCSKCRSTHMVPMDYPNNKLGLKCMLCCHEVYFKQIDMASNVKSGGRSEYIFNVMPISKGNKFSMDL